MVTSLCLRSTSKFPLKWLGCRHYDYLHDWRLKMSAHFPTLEGVHFYFPAQVRQQEDLVGDILIVGRWLADDHKKGCLHWEGVDVSLTGLERADRGGIIQSAFKSHEEFSLKTGDILLVKAKRSGASLLALRWELLAPQQHVELQEIKEFKEQKRLRQFMHFKHEIMTFFIENDFVEILTPTLVACPGTEPYLEPIEVEHSSKVYLPTSPEIHLKKALNQGFSKIFEIKNCFRNGESGEHHQLEFLMLEWYRAFGHLGQIQDDLQKLLHRLANHFKVQVESSIQSFSTKELFNKYCGFELEPATSRDQLFKLAQDQNLHPALDSNWDDCFFLIFITKIEPVLKGLDRPVLVYDYPPQLAAYSRISDSGWAQRFELYWKGLEICNAFQEVNDPQLQKERFSEDLAKKADLGKKSVGLDGDFIKSLEKGFPPSAGIALGLERLFMALMDIESIGSLKVFPYTQIT